MQQNLNTEDTEITEKNKRRRLFCGRFRETPLQFVHVDDSNNLLALTEGSLDTDRQSRDTLSVSTRRAIQRIAPTSSYVVVAHKSQPTSIHYHNDNGICFDFLCALSS